MRLLARLLLLCFCVSLSESLLCYQCADSSAKDGRNDCQTYVRTMNRYRERYTETDSANKYVTNCTGYRGLHELDIYCMILEVKDEFADDVRSYIRGCTDGYDFLDVDASIEIDQKINFQNRTQCVNVKNGLQACITLCGLEHGDFCNGYVSKTARLGPNLLPLLLFLLALFLS